MNPIRQLRLQVGITQKKLAEMAQTSQSTIAFYEMGAKSPTLSTLYNLAKSQGLETAIIFTPPLTKEDRRSLAYHDAIMQKLASDTSLIDRAKKNLDDLLAQHPHAKKLFFRWQDWLNLPLDQLISNVLDPGLDARDMRQVTPFSGFLTARERKEVIRKLNEGTSQYE